MPKKHCAKYGNGKQNIKILENKAKKRKINVEKIIFVRKLTLEQICITWLFSYKKNLGFFHGNNLEKFEKLKNKTFFKIIYEEG